MTQAIPASIFYPESDGQPMTESDATRDYLLYCVAVLEHYFSSRPKVYVSGNLFVYYQEGDSKKVISPDVFVIFGVSQRKRRSYKAWQEDDRLPQFVLEVTSRSTRKQDEVTKPELYASLGITEYFQYDPTGDYLDPQLKGQRLVNGVYQPLPIVTNWAGLDSIYSQTLDLELCLESSQMRFYDPRSQDKLLSYAELMAAKAMADQTLVEAQRQTDEAQQMANAAQLRAERLAERLRAIGIDPDAEV
jgi:Uma2 family endonuclease